MKINTENGEQKNTTIATASIPPFHLHCSLANTHTHMQHNTRKWFSNSLLFLCQVAHSHKRPTEGNESMYCTVQSVMSSCQALRQFLLSLSCHKTNTKNNNSTERWQTCIRTSHTRTHILYLSVGQTHNHAFHSNVVQFNLCQKNHQLESRSRLNRIHAFVVSSQ